MNNTIRPVDANHMLSRIGEAQSKEDFVIKEAVKQFINTEETLEHYRDPSDEISWRPAKRERRTQSVHAVSYGVECTRCHCFMPYERKFCPDCGGWYGGEINLKQTVNRIRNFFRRK